MHGFCLGHNPSSLNKMLHLIPVQIKWELWYCRAEQVLRVGFKILFDGSQLSAPVISNVSPQWKIRFRPCSFHTSQKLISQGWGRS